MKLQRFIRHREVLVLLILIILIMLVGMINPSFLQTATLLSILNTSLILVLVSIGETFVILTRGIDVSVGASMGISAVILGVSLNAGFPLGVAILFALLTGMLAGLITASAFRLSKSRRLL